MRVGKGGSEHGAQEIISALHGAQKIKKSFAQCTGNKVMSEHNAQEIISAVYGAKEIKNVHSA